MRTVLGIVVVAAIAGRVAFAAFGKRDARVRVLQPAGDQTILDTQAAKDQAGNPDLKPWPTGTEAGPHKSLVRIPGMPDGDPPVDLMPLDAVGGNLGDTHKYANIASYEQNMQELVKELDDSEEQARRMRLELMKKDLWLGSMLHREVIIDTDLNERKQELAAGFAHVAAIRARIDRIRKERRALELMAQKHQFDSAVDTLKMQVNDVEQVSSALDNRVKNLHDTISAKVEDEAVAMRKSLQPGVAAGVETDAAAYQAVSAAVGNVPAMVSLLQSGTGNLRATRKE